MKAVVTEKRKSRFIAFFKENFEALKTALSNEENINEEITDVELLKSFERIDKLEKKQFAESVKFDAKKSGVSKVNVSGGSRKKYEPRTIKKEVDEKERE